MSSKTFAVVEAIDSPKGAMLVRYQAIEAREPNAEEKADAELEAEERAGGIDPDLAPDFKAHLAAKLASMYPPMPRLPRPMPTYNVEDKNVICLTPEDVVAAIREAKEAHDAIKKLQKSGALVHVPYSSLH